MKPSGIAPLWIVGNAGASALLAGALLFGAALGARAQGDRLVPPLPVGKPATPVSAPAVPMPTPAPAPKAAAKEWSGESGSSGHPLMQAAEIRNAALHFESCLDEKRSIAVRLRM